MILEPKLLQLAYDVLNKQYEYDNNLYLDEFLIRAQKVVNQLQESCSRTQKVRLNLCLASNSSFGISRVICYI